jgi:hypothetical protein
MNSSNTINTNVGGNTPLELFQPFNLIVFSSFYSPIILAVFLLSISFIKGFIYLGFLLGCSVMRNFIYKWSNALPFQNDNTICTSIQYTKYGNPNFSAFVFAFTITYLSIPMFSNDSPNFVLFSVLLVYFFLDIFIKLYKKCSIKMGDLFLNVLMGVASSALIVTLMYMGGSGKYLYFNEISSNKEICYKPKEQTFKCSLYKNGELVGNL